MTVQLVQSQHSWYFQSVVNSRTLITGFDEVEPKRDLKLKNSNDKYGMVSVSTAGTTKRIGFKPD